MKAVILAAGMGTRLGDITTALPKCLLELNGKKIIESQIQELLAKGIDNIIVVVGYRSEMIRKVLGEKVVYVENKIFDKTNSSYSLRCAREYLSDGWLHMNCDLLFSPGILERVLKIKNANSIVVDFDLKPTDDQEKVRVENGVVVEMSKTMPFEKAHGKTIGMAQFSPLGAKVVLDHLERVINSGDRSRWFFSIIADVLDHLRFKAVTTDGEFWAEIDTPEDLKNTRKVLGESAYY